MPSYSYIFIIRVAALFYFLHFSIAAIARSSKTDQQALLEIKAKITHDPQGVMSSWNNTLNFCEWHGVFCGHRHKRVTRLDLKSSQLTGYLSPYVGNLSFLRELSISNNSFVGGIPPEIVRLGRLKYLLLTNNSFAGEIPSNISACSSLVVMAITNNRLVGRIPFELGFLPNLQHLALSANNLTGTIPSSLGNLSSLSQFYIGRNNLVGGIPDSLGKLSNLTILASPLNKLSGTVPSTIFNLSSLVILDIGSNDLEGNLASNSDISLPKLRVFSISTNRFTGSIPVFISNSSSLEYLQASSNNLQGQVPSLQKLQNLTHLALFINFLGNGVADDLNFISSLANASRLLEFDIGSNNFKGIFPECICNFSMLAYLNLERNMIAGQVPNCIGNLVNLERFNSWGNQLSGDIPPTIGKLQSLQHLDLSINQISGVIPSSIGNLTKMILLQLSQTNLEGEIPSTLGNCTNLEALDLSQNNHSGSIPSQILSLSSLTVALYLNNNHLSGSLPEEVGELNNLEGLDISVNILSGEIPSTIGGCLVLETLFMNGNLFHGAIPDEIKTLKGLRELDFSYNNLSGKIPETLASLPLLVLNLSYNSNLEGEVPVGGVFNNGTGFSIIGNYRLCGGIPKLKLPKCNFNKTRKRKRSQRGKLLLALLLGLLGVSLLVGLVVATSYTIWKKRKSNKPEAPSDTENFPNLSYQSLLKATDGFSSENLIGSGTYGVVYRGTLDNQDRTIVAVKVFKLDQHGASKSFMAECGVLRNIRHRNLVKIVTACSSLDHQGNDFIALIYAYMENGSLEEWLHPTAAGGTSSVEGTSNESRKLNLHQRLDIAIDVAFALEYLHHQCGASIIHCDLKPSNVLLDGELVAHVGDFGLAKFLSRDINNSSTSQSSSIGVRGTIGYAPPEYGIGMEVSTNGDVYSFGILLLEMFTGRRPTDENFIEGLTLHGFVKEALPGQVTEILDHALLKDMMDEETSSSMLQALIYILGIALSCSDELPQERLDMGEVAAKLSSTRNKLHAAHRLQSRRRIQAGIDKKWLHL